MASHVRDFGPSRASGEGGTSGIGKQVEHALARPHLRCNPVPVGALFREDAHVLEPRELQGEVKRVALGQRVLDFPIVGHALVRNPMPFGPSGWDEFCR